MQLSSDPELCFKDDNLSCGLWQLLFPEYNFMPDSEPTLSDSQPGKEVVWVTKFNTCSGDFASAKANWKL